MHVSLWSPGVRPLPSAISSASHSLLFRSKTPCPSDSAGYSTYHPPGSLLPEEDPLPSLLIFPDISVHPSVKVLFDRIRANAGQLSLRLTFYEEHDSTL